MNQCMGLQKEGCNPQSRLAIVSSCGGSGVKDTVTVKIGLRPKYLRPNVKIGGLRPKYCTTTCASITCPAAANLAFFERTKE